MVCPVKIPFSKLLINMRHFVTKKNIASNIIENAMHSPTLFKLFSTIIRLTPKTPKPLLESVMKEWSKYKAMPLIPKKRFIK